MADDDSFEPPGAQATLDAILAAAWALLARGAARASEDWHWPVLASVDARDPEPAAPDARVVVLRTADASARRLVFHSDARAGKLAQFGLAPQACLVFHDRRRELQLRVQGPVDVHRGDAAARRAWDALAASSRRAYLAPRTPGERTQAPDANLPDAFADRLPDAHEAEPGFANFAAVSVNVRRMEWLQLGRAGHRRARFDWDDDSTTDAAWIRP
jgi:pyridoxamine 5'-phosphate oxidase